MSEQEFPTITDELLKALDGKFPERTPDPQWTDRDIWMRVGERRVVRFLMGERQRQIDNMRT